MWCYPEVIPLPTQLLCLLCVRNWPAWTVWSLWIYYCLETNLHSMWLDKLLTLLCVCWNTLRSSCYPTNNQDIDKRKACWFWHTCYSAIAACDYELHVDRTNEHATSTLWAFTVSSYLSFVLLSPVKLFINIPTINKYKSIKLILK